MWGELGNNVLVEKNKAAWEAALKAAGNRDFVLRILLKANRIQFEAKVGSNAEAPTLCRFALTYFTTIQDWLAKRLRGFRADRCWTRKACHDARRIGYHRNDEKP